MTGTEQALFEGLGAGATQLLVNARHNSSGTAERAPRLRADEPCLSLRLTSSFKPCRGRQGSPNRSRRDAMEMMMTKMNPMIRTTIAAIAVAAYSSTRCSLIL